MITFNSLHIRNIFFSYSVIKTPPVKPCFNVPVIIYKFTPSPLNFLLFIIYLYSL